MGQKVKNLLRDQSKYGLMGSSAKTGKKIFRGSQEHFLHKSTIWDRTPPHLHIKCLHVCRRVQGSQIFKRNSIISIHSKVMAFLVILLSPCGPRGPHIVPVIPTSSLSSPCCPHCPHVIPIASRRSPCGPHGCGLRGLHPMLSPLSPWSPHCPHIIPTLSRRSYIIPNPQIPTLPTPTPLGGGEPQISKNAIRIELIKIF